MTHALSISDGTSTFSLTDSGCTLLHYAPQNGSMAAYEAGRTVTEEIQIWINGASRSAVNDSREALQRLLWRAAERNRRKIGPRVYLNWTPMNEASAYRSEIIDGALLPDDNIMQAWGNNVLPARLVIERVPYREGPQSELPLWSIANTTSGTGGRSITNGTNNYVSIDGADVEGDCPAPVYLTLQNTTGATLNPARFFLGNNAANWNNSDPSEQATNLYVTSASGSISLSTSWTDLESFTFSDTWVYQMGGRRFRIMALTSGFTATTDWFRAQIRDSGVTIWQSSVGVRGGTYELLDMGSAPMPPGGYTATWSPLTVTMQGYGSGGVDFTRLFAIGTDSFAKIRQRGGDLDANEYLEFDFIEERYWLFNSSSQRQPFFSAPSGILNAFPGEDQRIYIMFDEQDGSFPTAATMTVRAYYRPRRLVV